MINKINSKPSIPKRIKRKLNKLKPFKCGLWDENDGVIKDFKFLLKIQLLKIQNNKCAYCGLPLNTTGKTEIEHFSPKGGCKRPNHTELAFSRYNLVLSCNLCNSPIKKGIYDTIKIKDINYKKCTFKIVHPYFDEPSLHYKWVIEDEKILIQYLSEKGDESIKLFDLNSSSHAEERVKIKVREVIPLQKKDWELIKETLEYK